MHPWQCDLGLSAADNSIAHAAAAARTLDAAIPLRSAETDLQNTKELRTMATQIAAPKPDGSRRPRRKTTILKHFLKGILKENHQHPKWKNTKTVAKAPFATFMHTLQSDLGQYHARSRSSEEPWRSHSNTICRDCWVARCNTITHNGYTNCSSKTGSTPAHKNDNFQALFQRNFKGKSSAPKWRKTCCQSTSRNFHAKTLQYDLRQGLAKQNQNRKTALENKYPSRNLGAAIPLLSAQTGLHNTQELQHTTVEHIASIHQFQCTTCRNTCKTQKHSINKKEKSHLEPSVPLPVQFETDSTVKHRRPATVAQASQLFSATDALFTRTTQCFVQILTFKSHPDVAVPMRSANSHLQTTIRIASIYCRTSTIRAASAQPFHCDLQKLNFTTQKNCNTIL